MTDREVRFAKWIVGHWSDLAWAPYDHACIECVPDGDMIIAGFKCSYHEAKAMLAERDKDLIENKVPKIPNVPKDPWQEVMNEQRRIYSHDNGFQPAFEDFAKNHPNMDSYAMQAFAAGWIAHRSMMRSQVGEMKK